MPLPPVETPNGRLNGQQDAFVDAFVANGGDGIEAAKAAGYGGQRIDHHARRLLNHPVVAAEIQRRTAQLLRHLAPRAVQTMQRLVGGARSEYVQLQAAMDLLDRLGMRAPERHEHQVTGDLKVIIDLSGDEDHGGSDDRTRHDKHDPPGGHRDAVACPDGGVENVRVRGTRPTPRGFSPRQVRCSAWAVVAGALLGLGLV